MNNTPRQPAPRIIIWFLIAWTVLNIAQAATLELHADEAYYWLYSKFLDWGYFDHPPMVALFIKAGDYLMHNELGLRLVNILASTASVYILWLTARRIGATAKWFMLVAGGMFTLHIYGFITTPDGPLLLFTALFFYVYQQYAEQHKIGQAVWLGIIIACLLYSKYHGILLVGFTVLSNITLLKRGSFWLIAAIAITLYLPHILWQINHNYPSVTYHLADRSAKEYRFSYTFFYILSQTLMAGVFTGWLWFTKGFTLKAANAFERCLKWNFAGILVFFLFSSLRNEVQPQWTIIAFAALLVFLSASLSNHTAPAWLPKLAIANIVVIVAIRLLMIIQPPFVWQVRAVKGFFGNKEWALKTHKNAGNHWLVMSDGFQMPAKYCYYNNTLKCFSYDSRYYRLTQFDIWALEDSVQNKQVYFLSRGATNFTTDSIVMPKQTWYGGLIDSLRTYQRIVITPNKKNITAHAGQAVTLQIRINNPYHLPVNFSNKGKLHKAFLQAVFFSDDNQIANQQADSTFNNVTIQPGQNKTYPFIIKAPQKKGKYDMLLSIITDPFEGTRNSGYIHFTVE